MVHTVVFRVADAEALDFWADRLAREGVAVERDGDRLSFADPEGLGLELRVVETTDDPLIAEHPEIPAELAIQGFDGVRAYSVDPEHSRRFLEETLGFAPHGEAAWEIRGDRRGGFYTYDEPPAEPGVPGAGTVHHVAWATTQEEHAEWRERVARSGARPTPVIERFYFRSVYFREPSGVLFELATLGPGFAVDEPLEHLGERLSLPPAFEHLREQIEPRLTPLPDPRAAWTAR
jgi:glyoxalase family protein